MNSSNNDKKKLKSLIENIVSEEITRLDEGSVIFDHPFVRGFVEPFLDIYKTAKAELTKIVATAFENTKKLAKQAVFLTIPFIGISAIKKAEREASEALKKRISSINEQYRDVYERTYKALKNPDVLGFTFLLDPALPFTKNFALAVKLVKDAPGPMLEALEVLTGGHPKVVDLKRKYLKATELPTFGSSTWGGSGGFGFGYDGGYDFGGFGGGDGGGDGGGGGESVYRTGNVFLSEQQVLPTQRQKARFKRKPSKAKQQDPAKILAAEIQNLLKEPDVVAAMKKSPIVKQFQLAGIEAIVNSIKPVMKAKTYDELKRVVPDFDKIEAELKKQLPEEGATPEQLAQFKRDFVEEFKKLYKEMFIKDLEREFSKSQGALDNKLFRQILQKLKTL